MPLVAALLVGHLARAQAGWVTARGYEGVIFAQEHSVSPAPDLPGARFTPTRAEVAAAEAILARQLAAANAGAPEQGGGCPLIHRRTRAYWRQYVGFVNGQGQKVIWVNLLWKDPARRSALAQHVVQVLDGCSYYWNVKVNLLTGRLYELRINGRA
ncbi:hypothetical protein [Hymenobacter segetis]